MRELVGRVPLACFSYKVHYSGGVLAAVEGDGELPRLEEVEASINLHREVRRKGMKDDGGGGGDDDDDDDGGGGGGGKRKRMRRPPKEKEAEI